MLWFGYIGNQIQFVLKNLLKKRALVGSLKLKGKNLGTYCRRKYPKPLSTSVFSDILARFRNSNPNIRGWYLMDEEQQSSIKQLIAKGKEQGYLTYAEVNDHLPSGIVEPEQIEDIVSMINDMGIKVHEQAPDEDSLLLTDNTAADDDVAEEAAAALATVDSEFGRTTDPVRMYMREMGIVNLLTREGEIKIAKQKKHPTKTAVSPDRPPAETPAELST